MHVSVFKIFKTSICIRIAAYVLYLSVYCVSTLSSKTMFTAFLFVLSLPLLFVQENRAQNLKSACVSSQISSILCHNTKMTPGKLGKWQFTSIWTAARVGEEGGALRKQQYAMFSNCTCRLYGHVIVSLRNIFHPNFLSSQNSQYWLLLYPCERHLE